MAFKLSNRSLGKLEGVHPDMVETVKKAIEVDSLISRKKFKGFGIVDCNSTWKPSFLVKAIAGRKAKKFDTTILFDYDAWSIIYCILFQWCNRMA